MEPTAKHGPRMDDELKHEVEPLTRGPGAEANRRPQRRQQDPPGDGTETPTEARAELARSLSPSSFPATRQELLDQASEAFAPGWVVDLLRRLPEDDTAYRTTDEVWRAAGGAEADAERAGH